MVFNVFKLKHLLVLEPGQKSVPAIGAARGFGGTILRLTF